MIGAVLFAVACGGGGSTNSGTGGNGGSTGSGGHAGSSSGTPHACVGTTCAAEQVCVAYRTVGGGQIYPDSSGNCPAGSHSEPASWADAGAICVANFAYQCVQLEGCFGGAPVTCDCAMLNAAETSGTCPTGYPACSNPSSTYVGLDPDAQLICEQQAP